VLALAVHWLLDQGEIIALWGARGIDQLAAVTDAMEWRLGASAMQDIDRIFNKSNQG